ncbi:MAG TPA: ComEC/Rec2 family competence protein [Verrucomicrobiae bacterium]|nr:ComEC/Rec2 family competence protein [Verrucomicrobiae bacterium]
MKQPFVPIVLLYAVGLLTGNYLSLSVVLLFAVSTAFLALAFFSGKARPFLLGALLMLAGWLNIELHTRIISPDDLRTIVQNGAGIVTVRGTLAETPDARIFLRGNDEVLRSVATVRLANLRFYGKNDFEPVAGTVVVTTPGVLPKIFFRGQSVEITGVIAPPDLPKAEGVFDYRDYLKKLAIFYQMETGSTNDWRLGPNPSAKIPFSDRFIAWATKTLTRGLDVSDESTQLLLAMTLGQKTALTDEVSEPFMRSGTMHIFAISGLHIALIAGILLGLLRVIQLPRIICGVIVLPLIWFYTAATGWQPSAIRSTIMMSVIIGGWMLKRPGNLLNSLAAAAFIILLWDPLQLFQASFQLSFFVVLSIALLAPPLNKIRDRLLQPDPFLPPSLVPRWRRWLGKPLFWLATCFTTSLAAWMGSMPLTALYFHLFSPVTLLANIIIVPLSGFALMAELGSLICSAWLPWIGELFNNAAWFFMHAMIGASNAVTKIPGAFFYVPSPSWTMIAIYFAALIAVLTGWFNRLRRQLSGAAILFLIGAVFFWDWESSRDETEITVLPLNGGQAVYVDAAGRKNDWLIDCGNENAVNFTLKNFLRARGVNTIPRLALTVGKARDCGGAILLDELFGVRELWTGAADFRSGVYRKIVSDFETSSRRRVFVCGSQTGAWKVFWPEATNCFSRADDNALVLRGDFYATKILLLSDLGREGQSELLNRKDDLRADIVIAGLPADDEPLSDAMIDSIQPKAIVIVDSDFPPARRASRELKERLKQTKIPVVYTCESGAVKIMTDKSGWKLQTMDGQIFEAGQNLQD